MMMMLAAGETCWQRSRRRCWQRAVWRSHPSSTAAAAASRSTSALVHCARRCRCDLPRSPAAETTHRYCRYHPRRCVRKPLASSLMRSSVDVLEPRALTTSLLPSWPTMTTQLAAAAAVDTTCTVHHRHVIHSFKAGMLSPRCGLGLGLVDVMTSASYSLASSPHRTFVNVYASGQYATAAPLSERVLCVPASSAPAERVFSQSGLIMRPNRARMSEKNTWRTGISQGRF